MCVLRPCTHTYTINVCMHVCTGALHSHAHNQRMNVCTKALHSYERNQCMHFRRCLALARTPSTCACKRNSQMPCTHTYTINMCMHAGATLQNAIAFANAALTNTLHAYTKTQFKHAQVLSRCQTLRAPSPLPKRVLHTHTHTHTCAARLHNQCMCNYWHRCQTPRAPLPLPMRTLPST